MTQINIIPPTITISENDLHHLSKKHKIDLATITELLQSFNSFDKNRDGYISHQDLLSVVQLIGHEYIHINDSEVLELIKCADKDFDNLIKFEEYIILLKPFIDQVVTNFTDEGILVDKTFNKEGSKDSNLNELNDSTRSQLNNRVDETTFRRETSKNASIITVKPNVNSYQSRHTSGNSAKYEQKSGFRSRNNSHSQPAQTQAHNISINQNQNHHSSTHKLSPNTNSNHESHKFSVSHAPISNHSSKSHLDTYTINEKQEANLHILFNIYDRDRNGYITRDEINEVMNSLGENLSENDLDEMMMGNSRIDFEQFKILLLGDLDYNDPNNHSASQMELIMNDMSIQNNHNSRLQSQEHIEFIKSNSNLSSGMASIANGQTHNSSYNYGTQNNHTMNYPAQNHSGKHLQLPSNHISQEIQILTQNLNNDVRLVDQFLNSPMGQLENFNNLEDFRIKLNPSCSDTTQNNYAQISLGNSTHHHNSQPNNNNTSLLYRQTQVNIQTSDTTPSLDIEIIEGHPKILEANLHSASSENLMSNQKKSNDKQHIGCYSGCCLM